MKSVISICIIIAGLLTVVVLKMEERRRGYYVWKLSREVKIVREELMTKKIRLAKLTRPQYVEKMAQQKLTLQKVKTGQVIHLPGPQL